MNKFFDGLKSGVGFAFGLIIVISLVFGVVYAVGFHTADEIISGTFLGNYVFNGEVNFTQGVKLNGSSNSFNKYEEGSFSPTLVSINGVSPTVTYGAQQGYYTRIGNRVFVDFVVSFTSHSGGTGNVAIGGLPFNFSSLQSTGSLGTFDFITFSGGRTYLGFYGDVPTNKVYLRQMGSNTGTANFAFTDVAQSSTILGSITYITNDP